MPYWLMFAAEVTVLRTISGNRCCEVMVLLVVAATFVEPKTTDTKKRAYSVNRVSKSGLKVKKKRKKATRESRLLPGNQKLIGIAICRVKVRVMPS